VGAVIYLWISEYFINNQPTLAKYTIMLIVKLLQLLFGYVIIKNIKSVLARVIFIIMFLLYCLPFIASRKTPGSAGVAVDV